MCLSFLFPEGLRVRHSRKNGKGSDKRQTKRQRQQERPLEKDTQTDGAEGGGRDGRDRRTDRDIAGKTNYGGESLPPRFPRP